MIGRIMTANTTPAVIIVRPEVDAGPAKNGRKPRLSSSQGNTERARIGASTEMPQMPNTTLGIAASRSTK